ncbi:response regulator [Aureitalea sp. L0-47]|uniref:ATP-binding protein n=1 Tax=Aureitalea sp. L0-47 TaxID=2816962 RepID=UPI00223834CB|nr:ATP-binding protein [Aureitalea sp. L0-47]MCW5520107.1 response regulator [Aureitalea sp. L0-47]
MNTLINRFFTRNEAKELIEEQCNDSRRIVLNYLYDLASRSTHIPEFESEVLDIRFDEDPFFADLQLVRSYLYAENYLVNKDPRFIGNCSELREKTKEKFFEVMDQPAFKLLLDSEANQKSHLARLYLLYLIKKVQKDHPQKQLTKNWLERIHIMFPEKYGFNIVDRINLFRRVKETSVEIYDELCDTLGNNETERLFYESYEDLQNIYRFNKQIIGIKEIIPEGKKVPQGIPVRKLIAVKDKNEGENSNYISGAHYKSVLENMLDGFVLIDKHSRILDANTKAMQILELTQDELANHTITEFLPDEISRGIKQDLNRLDSSIPSIFIGKRIETVLSDNSGSKEDYEITITNNFHGDNETYTVLLTNISHKKHMLEAIQEAKVNAERSAKAKSTFLSNMSHEIRTPLNVILGLSDIIKKSASGENEILQKNIDGIDFSAKNLLSIVNDILDFSKIEAGKLTLQSIDFNLRKVVETISDGFAIKANEKGLDLISEMDKDIPDMVIGDQYRLNQILTNLIGNAIKFTKQGAINIKVELVSVFEDEVKLKFSVKDTGIGISEENLSKIFDSFYQVENREDNEIAGTGLGLAITRELIKLQDGEFHANSKLHVGSEFEVTLPFKKSKLKSLNDSIKTFVREDKNLEGLKVLVAEDNKMNQFYIRQLLSNLKVTVDIAENGKEAVEIFQQDTANYDLILMDMHMPVMNGIEAISKIRRTNKDKLKKVPIVACSADVFPEARKSAIKAGIDFYLTKPVSEDALKEVLFWLRSDEAFEPQISGNQISSRTQEEENIERSVNINHLMETFDNDEEFISSLLEVFIQTTPEEYKSMRTCIDREYYARASAMAHKMKSSFMNLGMTVHGHHLQQIESNIIKRDGIEEAKRHLSLFSQLYNKALLEVNLLLIELKQN